MLAHTATAQLQFDDLVHEQLPRDRSSTSAIAAGDVDGDGDFDLVLTSYAQQNRLYLNDGTGTFTDATLARMPTDILPTLAAAIGDVDGDGDLDLVLGNAGSQTLLYLNDGTGTFRDATSTRMPARRDTTTAIVLADVDRDGDLDLVLGQGGQNRLYLNDGTGRFADVTAVRMPVDNDSTLAVTMGDVDGDNDLDMVFGNHLQQNRLYLNDGTGTFGDVTSAWMPPDLESTSVVVLGDVDRDGDLDLVLGNSGTHGEQNRLYLNDGTGRFADATAVRMPIGNDRTLAVAMADVDGDGDRDLVIGNELQQNRLYLNDGAGNFSVAPAARTPADVDRTFALVLEDADGDGDADLFVGNFGHQDRILVNDGSGTFTDPSAARMPAQDENSRVASLADVDGDGDLDLILGNGGAWGAQQNRLYLNDGTGVFRDATASHMPNILDGTTSTAACDVDGDGDLDLVFGSYGGSSGQQNRLYLNNGTGTFTDATSVRMPVVRGFTGAVAVDDLDGDGDVDLVFGNWGQNWLFLNDGTGTFSNVSLARLPRDNDSTSDVALGDVDGDGDPDLVLANSGRNRLYINDGNGTFTDSTAGRMPVDADLTLAVSVTDVDGDGDNDLVFGFAPIAGRMGAERLYLNDGSGVFTDATAARMPARGYETLSIAAGDVDDDGDTDLVLSGNGRRRLYLNDGTGTFLDGTVRLPMGGESTQSLVLGDVDGDGDQDVVFGNDGQNRLYLNLLRQLDAPAPARIGQAYTLDAYARYGVPRLVDVALPYVSSATAQIPLPPFGTVGIDPASMIPLAPFVIVQPAGVASVTQTIPNNASLVGLPIHAQALLLQWPTAAFLTNVTSDPIVR